jgi:hypothetical protein
MATAKKTTTRFYSRGHAQTVTIRSPEIAYDDHGHRIEKGGEIADFAPDGWFETDDPEVVEILREREGFNLDFFEEGNEIGAIKPTESDQIEAIIEATAAEDDEAIQQVLDDEKAGHNRPSVVGAATAALVNVRKAKDVGTERSNVELAGEEEGDLSKAETNADVAKTDGTTKAATEKPGATEEPANKDSGKK